MCQRHRDEEDDGTARDIRIDGVSRYLKIAAKRGKDG
jgi:hypothetical protein